MNKIDEIFKNPLTVALVIILSILSIGTTHRIYIADLAHLESRIAKVEQQTESTAQSLHKIELSIEQVRGSNLVILSKIETIQKQP